MDIVTHSIYTDKEVFLRELISNASDSLEKYRYTKSTGTLANADDEPLEINISVNPKKRTLTISDNGIGMSSEELVSNLGTIARSGSKQFVEQIQSSGESSSRDGDGIIGQFGVGFYSAFMVSKEVSVESLSALASQGESGATWSSSGSGDFTIDPTVGARRGSRIEMQLKESCKEFADVKKVKEIIKKYSNFVPFPIKVEGEVVNTISAIWVQDKNSVTEDQYTEFYKYISNAFDKPAFKLHFSTDAPINLNTLLFVPTFHTEKFGQGRMEAGVSLYSRKVLIESKPADLLPDWLRFVKGVVDSEDLPLSISREKPQDSMLLKKIKDVLTRKLLRVFADLQKNDPVKYKEFYIEFNNFLKEGICQDYGYQKQLSKLLMFESSSLEDGVMTSLDEYASRCKPDQKKIYYLVAPNRSSALNSPYYETFKKNGIEVLFLYTTIDDFVMSNVRTFGDKALTSAETSSLDLPGEGSEDKAADGEDASSNKEAKGDLALTGDEAKVMCAWLKVALGSRVSDVKITTRLSDSPAIVTDHESGTMRRMIRMVVSIIEVYHLRAMFLSSDTYFLHFIGAVWKRESCRAPTRGVGGEP